METTLQTPEAQAVLEKVNATYGFTPNLFVEMATHSPAVAEVYFTSNQLFGGASLSPQETQAVILAVSAHNKCHYCTAAHRMVGKMTGLPESEIDAILAGEVPQDARLQSLVSATRQVLDRQGWLGEDNLRALDAKGVTRGQLYEIVTLIGIKTISNYINHIANTEVDPQFG